MSLSLLFIGKTLRPTNLLRFWITLLHNFLSLYLYAQNGLYSFVQFLLTDSIGNALYLYISVSFWFSFVSVIFLQHKAMIFVVESPHFVAHSIESWFLLLFAWIFDLLKDPFVNSIFTIYRRVFLIEGVFEIRIGL